MHSASDDDVVDEWDLGPAVVDGFFRFLEWADVDVGDAGDGGLYAGSAVDKGDRERALAIADELLVFFRCGRVHSKPTDSSNAMRSSDSAPLLLRFLRSQETAWEQKLYERSFGKQTAESR